MTSVYIGSSLLSCSKVHLFYRTCRPARQSFSVGPNATRGGRPRQGRPAQAGRPYRAVVRTSGISRSCPIRCDRRSRPPR